MRAAALSALFGCADVELAPGGALHSPLGVRAFGELVLPIFAAAPSESGPPLTAHQAGGWLDETLPRHFLVDASETLPRRFRDAS